MSELLDTDRLTDTEQQHWLNRGEALGKAYGRYLWLLLVLGLFFAALRTQPASPDPMSVPAVDLKLNPTTVLAWSGSILSLLVLAAIGAVRAWSTALEKYLGRKPTKDDAERLDMYPNALD